MANIRVVAGRAEELQGEFDWIVSRAVTPADVLHLPFGLNRALLVGAADAAGYSNAQRLPWGKDRFLVTVPRETVSRGTSGP
jgi:hypothetical protein